MWTMRHSVPAGTTLAAGIGTTMLWAASAPDARQFVRDNPVRVLPAAARTTDPGTVVFGPPPGKRPVRPSGHHARPRHADPARRSLPVSRFIGRRGLFGLALAAAPGALAVRWVAAQSDTPSGADTVPRVVVWKDPNCGCCGGWAQQMRRAGFPVAERTSGDLGSIKQARGVPDHLVSCHTAAVDGYVVEGHVPAADILRLLRQRPAARGLAAPGMPAVAPGMDQRSGEPYRVVLFGTAGGDRAFARHAAASRFRHVAET